MNHKNTELEQFSVFIKTKVDNYFQHLLSVLYLGFYIIFRTIPRLKLVRFKTNGTIIRGHRVKTELMGDTSNMADGGSVALR